MRVAVTHSAFIAGVVTLISQPWEIVPPRRFNTQSSTFVLEHHIIPISESSAEDGTGARTGQVHRNGRPLRNGTGSVWRGQPVSDRISVSWIREPAGENRHPSLHIQLREGLTDLPFSFPL